MVYSNMKVGAILADTVAELWEKCDCLAKVKEIEGSEYKYLRQQCSRCPCNEERSCPNKDSSFDHFSAKSFFRRGR